MQDAVAWLEDYRKFWQHRYEALDELLDQIQAKPRKKTKKNKKRR
jgi:hypothetical protein